MRKNKRLQMQKRHVPMATLHDDIAFDTDGRARCPDCLCPMRPVAAGFISEILTPNTEPDVYFMAWFCPDCNTETATTKP